MGLRVCVVGAGVVGLSVAVRLAEAGHRVDVIARDLPRETTSVVAAALWYPYRAAPVDRVTSWGAASYAEFARLAADATPGVRMLTGTEVHRATTPDPWWADAVPDLHRVEPGRRGFADAWRFTAPVVDMPVYLDWLSGRLAEEGGSLTRMSLKALPTGFDLVVNCSGMGARLLADDASVAPVRGQVVVLEQPADPIGEWFLDAEGPTYVVPREREIVVGGTAVEGEWSRTPDGQTAKAILDRANELVPGLSAAPVLRHKVGLRPARPTVRLERDVAEPHVVHCYGHGGSGVTISWGCADEVLSLVDG